MTIGIQLCEKEGGLIPILALDHGLTDSKDAVPLSKVSELISEKYQHLFGGVVMTYGLARTQNCKISVPLFIQCFGAPLGTPKVIVSQISRATSLGANGIAVQIDFDLPEAPLMQQVTSIATMVDEAHTSKLPVLFMVSHKATISQHTLISRIRTCHELGADLIKVRLDQAAIEEPEGLEALKAALSHSPPVLLAGGLKNKNIYDEIKLAKKAGFSGYCIGRNIYQAQDPFAAATELLKKWNSI